MVFNILILIFVYYIRRCDICFQISLIRDNKNLINSENEVKKVNKDNYDNLIEIMNKSLNLKGLLSLTITKDIILKLIDDEIITSFLNNIYSYKIHIKQYQYMLAWDFFKNICNITNLIDKQTLNEILNDDNLSADNAGTSGEKKSRTSSFSETRFGRRDSKRIKGNIVKERIILLECNFTVIKLTLSRSKGQSK